MRQSSADVMETLAKPMQLDLEDAMGSVPPTKCVEVTPEVVGCVRFISTPTRARERSRAKARDANV